MSSTVTTGREVQRPAITPVTSTLLDHATVVDVPNFGMLNDTGLWPSYNCLDMLTPTSVCPDPEAGYKQFEFATWQPAYTFAVYGGSQCLAVGLDRADMASETKKAFLASEAKGVEMSLVANRFVATDSDSLTLTGDQVEWAEADDLTPAGKTVPLTVALALLEGTAAAQYAGLPTIHMPRAAATMLETAGLIVWVGDKAYTKNGSKVAMGGGYDNPTMLASGKWDLYATGEVYVERSEMVEVQTFNAVNAIDSDESGLRANTVVTLAERMYRVAIDCLSLKATGTVWS